MVAKKWQGLHPYRLKDNPMEKAFAEAFEVLNKTGPGYAHNSTVDCLLSPDSNKPVPCSERDRTVAATLAQWLGSPVGVSWVMDTLAKNKKLIAHQIPKELTTK